MLDSTQFNGTIGPANLLGLVRNTAPFLFDHAFGFPEPKARGRLIEIGKHPYGWLDILRSADLLPAVAHPNQEQCEDYFALCLASHHATVATFVPTDVDAKIRGVLWHQRMDPASRRRMLDFTIHALSWDLSRISARTTELSGVGPVSGHNGEILSVLAGALGSFLKNEDREYAEKAAEAIEGELRREVHEFRHVLKMPGQEIELLRLAMSITHNCGDLDQGISFWNKNPIYDPYRARFGRLAHENATAFEGTFQISAKLYKNMLSSEGHRHYPLREVRCFRKSPDFLLPLGPFLDGWGERMGSHPGLTDDERAEVLGALVDGCRKVKNQMGYYRALRGMGRALGSNVEKLSRRLPASLRQELKNPEIKRQMAISHESFESSMRKRAKQVLA